jgi:hypothetical protein
VRYRRAALNFRQDAPWCGNEKRKVLSPKVVGAVGFEPTTSWSRTKRATKLRYAPADRRSSTCPWPMLIANSFGEKIAIIAGQSAEIGL